MEKYKLKQAIIVEGRYDAVKLDSIFDAVIITTGGFGVFRDKQKLRLIQRLARECGVIILTDSDAAGFKIRAYLGGAAAPGQVTHVYIPDIYGKERRKAHAGAEGKLGVEGVDPSVIMEAFTKAGISLGGVQGEAAPPKAEPVRKSDFMEWGLSGCEMSSLRRAALLRFLDFPELMSANALLRMINRLYTRDEFEKLLKLALSDIEKS